MGSGSCFVRRARRRFAGFREFGAESISQFFDVRRKADIDCTEPMERVVARHAGYVVVEKLGAGASFAVEHDPRSLRNPTTEEVRNAAARGN